MILRNLLEVVQHVQPPVKGGEIGVSEGLSAEVTIPSVFALVKEKQVGNGDPVQIRILCSHSWGFDFDGYLFCQQT